MGREMDNEVVGVMEANEGERVRDGASMFRVEEIAGVGSGEEPAGSMS